ncbi:MAG: gliding motility-associated C-terminal domain-containing protein [Crocinitomicaceae bacterium]|nr:gliding motility-associated C-terminal domain-containing protein [Crocinitomicaceae bacterium]
MYYSRILFLFFISSYSLFGQKTYSIVGDAYGIPDIVSPVCPNVDTCFTLTENVNGQAGAVWDDVPINLSKSFDALFCLTLGSNDVNGADGFAFVMRGLNSLGIGAVGEGIGYEGIIPSIGIEFDTWDNGTLKDDIPEDHTGMYHDSDFSNPVSGSVSLTPTGLNVEDGNYHNTRIVWNASAKILEMYFDGDLRISQPIDLINDVFSGDSLVFWGFTSSTGGATNLQQICFPYTSIHIEDVVVCEPNKAELSFYTENITSYTWYSEAGDTLVDWNTIDYSYPFNLDDTLISVNETGNYILNISFNNTSYSDTVQVIIVPLPLKPFEADSTMYCPDQEDITLDALNPGTSYLWTPSFPDSQVIVDNGYTGWYSVTIVEPINSCSITDSIYVGNYCDPLVNFPNVFTPNNDGVNDFYKPIFKGDPKWIYFNEFTIQNRWGNVVYRYKKGDSTIGWDGKSNGNSVADGVYFYNAVYSDILMENTQSKHGFLHLISE